MLFSIIDGSPQVELALKSKTKLIKAADTIASGTQMLVVDAIAIFGQTVWACIVTGFQLGRLYYVIKFIRRIQRHDMNEVVSIWPSIQSTWKDALVQMTTMKFRAPETATTRTTMFTDASLVGWGVVILGYGYRPIRIFAGRWSEAEAKESINVLELRTLRIGIRILAQLKSDDEIISLDTFIDNTSARAWAIRRRAPRWSTNQLVIEMDAEAKQAKIQMTNIDYVESARNLADKPSRRFIPK